MTVTETSRNRWKASELVEKVSKWRQARLIEGILVGEHEAALVSLGQAHGNPDRDSLFRAYDRYFKAIGRLNRFLAAGIVPRDIVEQIDC
jgi:hypothetical protein